MKQLMTDFRLQKIAQEYLDSNISIDDLAKKNELSKSSLIRYFNGENSVHLPATMQYLVDEKKKKRWIESKATKGNLGNLAIKDEELKQAAHIYVDNDASTLRSIAEDNGVSPATIFNNFTKEKLGETLYEEVKEKYESNHKGGGKTGV